MTVVHRPVGALFVALSLCACSTLPSPTPTTALTPALAVTSLPSVASPTAARAPSVTPTVIASPPTSPMPVPSATPPTFIRQLTSGGCCVQPYWSADGGQVRYIDRPSSGQPSGIWAISPSGGAPVFVTARLGIYSPDDRLVAYLEGGQTYVERLGAGRWRVDNGSRAVVFSPDNTRIAWQVTSSLFNLDQRQVQVWVAATDGTGARQLAVLTGGSLAGWFPDGGRLLVTSRVRDETLVQSLAVADGVLTPIVTVPRLQGLALSPLGGWLAYAIVFSGDPGQDGLWVIGVDGRGARRLDTFGSFAWRGEGRLLVVPLEATSPFNRLLEVQAATGQTMALIDPAVAPFQIAQGNWSVSPDGAHLAFVSAADRNIWVIDLAE